MHKRTEIQTADGSCPAHVFRPEGTAPRPGVLFFMDGIGIRPALFQMGERMAAAGYHVLLPDLYYRAGSYAPMDAKTVFSDPVQRAELKSRFMAVATVPQVMADTRAFLAHLSADPEVKRSRLGATGYCMGGRLALCAAGCYPEAFAVVASYHGGNLADDSPHSPHLLAPKMKARLYIAGAVEDATFPEVQKERLEQALTAAGVDHLLESYPARHGWVPTDTSSHDPAAAERHWETLLSLFAEL